MPTEYEKAHAAYRELAKKAASGDQQAKADKAKAMNDIRTIEREAARAGTVLSATYQGEKLVTRSEPTHSKRSLQEEYVRKFDGDTEVFVNGEHTTLQKFHAKRLLGR
jgi:CTP-dependent riboflavin kinase